LHQEDAAFVPRAEEVFVNRPAVRARMVGSLTGRERVRETTKKRILVYCVPNANLRRPRCFAIARILRVIIPLGLWPVKKSYLVYFYIYAFKSLANYDSLF